MQKLKKIPEHVKHLCSGFVRESETNYGLTAVAFVLTMIIIIYYHWMNGSMYIRFDI